MMTQQYQHRSGFMNTMNMFTGICPAEVAAGSALARSGTLPATDAGA